MWPHLKYIDCWLVYFPHCLNTSCGVHVQKWPWNQTVKNLWQEKLPPFAERRLFQGLQILLMGGVSVTSASQILESFWEYLESSITTKKGIFRLSSKWPWHVYTIVRDTRSSCGGPLTWKAQIHDVGHRVNFDRNLPSSWFVVQYNSLISII